MDISYCENCEKPTGHKRAIGAGTILGAVVTGGFSLLATPFYPLRCIVCGSAERSPGESGGAGDYHVPQYPPPPLSAGWGFLLCLAAVLAVAFLCMWLDV